PGGRDAPALWRRAAAVRGHRPMTVAEGRVSFVVAINQALREEMAEDPAIYVLGEDVAVGGPFGATAGLAETFGGRRVRNTPISEGTVMGLAVGAAVLGLRPVVEIMFVDFITLAM